MKRLTAGSPLKVICQTNDPLATVQLYHMTSQQDTETAPQYQGRVKREGQNFTFSSVDYNDGGRYQCKATDSNGKTIELVKGVIMVLHSKYT